MAESKTKGTRARVDAYLASRASPQQLADLDVKVLEALIAGSVAEVRYRYPGGQFTC